MFTALASSPRVRVFSPLCYLAGALDPGQFMDWPRQYAEQAIYVVEGSVDIDGLAISSYHMSVLPETESVRVGSGDGARIAILAGEPIGQRFLWWNFVSSNRERLREAAKTWADGGFQRVPGDDEYTPLPENRPIP